MAKLRFQASVPSQLRVLLQCEHRKYAADTPMSAEERILLRKWVAQGNSPYDNPGCFADESGRVMDFISAMRVLDDLAAEGQQI